MTEIRTEMISLDDLERYQKKVERIRIMTQGGADTWLCPTCAGDWSSLHFNGDASRKKVYGSHGIRSDTYTLPITCDHGHAFLLHLTACSGAFWIFVDEAQEESA